MPVSGGLSQARLSRMNREFSAWSLQRPVSPIFWGGASKLGFPQISLLGIPAPSAPQLLAFLRPGPLQFSLQARQPSSPLSPQRSSLREVGLNPGFTPKGPFPVSFPGLPGPLACGPGPGPSAPRQGSSGHRSLRGPARLLFHQPLILACPRGEPAEEGAAGSCSGSPEPLPSSWQARNCGQGKAQEAAVQPGTRSKASDS